MRKCSLILLLGRLAQALPKAIAFFMGWGWLHSLHLPWAPGLSWQGAPHGGPRSHGVCRLDQWTLLLLLSKSHRGIPCLSSLVLSHISDDKALHAQAAERARTDGEFCKGDGVLALFSTVHPGSTPCLVDGRGAQKLFVR